MPPDALNAGAGFASRLVSNIYGLHKQQSEQDNADAEKQRQSYLNILESAAQSGNVNPEDMPTLYSKMFELNGASKKELGTIMPHLQQAFTQSDTPRTTTFDHQSAVPAQTVGSGDFQSDLPAFSLPPVPTTDTGNTPAIRMMTPEDKATTAGKMQAASLAASYPQRSKEANDARDRKLALQGAKLTQQEQAKHDQIMLKGGIDAQRKFAERVNMFLPSTNGDVETARGLASKSMIRDEGAAVSAKEGQAKLSTARIANMQGRLEVARTNAATLSRRADIYSKAVAQAGAQAASGKGGAAATRNLKTFQAQTKELYAALTPLNNAIVKLETDPLNSDGGVFDPNVKAEVDKLKAQRDDIKGKLDTARQTWLPSMPEPTDGSVTPPVPQVSNSRGTTQPKGIIRRGNLNSVRGQNPTLILQHPEFAKDDNALIQYLQSQGYAVK